MFVVLFWRYFFYTLFPPSEAHYNAKAVFVLRLLWIALVCLLWRHIGIYIFLKMWENVFQTFLCAFIRMCNDLKPLLRKDTRCSTSLRVSLRCLCTDLKSLELLPTSPKDSNFRLKIEDAASVIAGGGVSEQTEKKKKSASDMAGRVCVARFCE